MTGAGAVEGAGYWLVLARLAGTWSISSSDTRFKSAREVAGARDVEAVWFVTDAGDIHRENHDVG